MANNKEQSKDLFDESSLDEMQKAENYRIGFRLFKACYWFMYFFSMYIFVAAVNMENTIFTVCGITAMAAASVFHIIYSALVSAKGVMNIKYAEAMSKPYTSAVYTICIILFGFVTLTGSHPIAFLMISIPYVMLICDCIFAKRNMRVLEKMLKDDSEEE
ncbi:MAG: hypothetical protein K2N26_07310 [Oscillospiraceae bacterium]|nr:hypothetical protein [Oscillospiraceae bacterium]